MGMSLAAAKPILKQKLQSDFDKIFEDAFYDALVAQFDESDRIEGGPKSEEDVKKRIDNKFRNASKKFANSISNRLATQISERIHDYVKEMMIVVNNAPVLPTIISPTGPCTGTISILPTNFKIT